MVSQVMLLENLADLLHGLLQVAEAADSTRGGVILSTAGRDRPTIGKVSPAL